jgi:sugar lactone lactonase YvrE
MMRRTLVAALAVALCAFSTPAGADAPAEASGFENPESVFWDGEAGAFYVSNFGGQVFNPFGREEDGFVSRLSAEGKVTEARWVTGLRTPKGIRRAGDLLYVADIGQVVVIDIAAGTIKTKIDLEPMGAQLPNDVALDEASGDLYVSDTMRNAIYRLPAGSHTPEVWLESPALESPNGLLVDGGNLMVAGFGRDLDPATFKPGSPGRLLTVDMATKAITTYADLGQMAQLDGIEKLGPDFLVTDNSGGRLVRVRPDGSTTDLAGGISNAADLALRPEDRLVAVPSTGDNVVKFLTVPA